MKLAVPRETAAFERRVALVPAACAKWVQAGVEVIVGKDAGREASFSDADYEAVGARVVREGKALLPEADLVVKVARPSPGEVSELREGAVVVSYLFPQENLDLVQRLAERKATVFSMDAVPRITRAQSMDALSSMSTLAGYKAVLVGAARLDRILPMMVTAAGTIRPAKAFILGAGVAGLQAIATARRLGAVVSAFDVRAATQEQVESLGAKFVSPDLGTERAEAAGGYAKELTEETQARNLATIGAHIRDMDLVITTALIPGRPAPTLITEEMVREMKPGAVIVDLAAERGGNCALTSTELEEVAHHGVTILAPKNLASTVAVHASEMYARNVSSFLKLIIRDASLEFDFDDEVIRSMCVVRQGEVFHEATRKLLESAAAPGAAPAEGERS